MSGGDGPPLTPEVPMTGQMNDQLTLDATTAVDRYLAALNEPDAVRRRAPHRAGVDPARAR